MARTLHPACLTTAALALSLPVLPSFGMAAFASASSRPFVIALSTLGDLSPYRTIAWDTLAFVDKGDLAAARARIKELETAWDKAEPSLKPNDATAWTTLDSMIDAALTDLRTPSPKADECAKSLKALIAKMDAIGKA